MANSNGITGRIGYPGPVVLSVICTLIGSLAYARHYLLDHNAASPTKMFFEFLVWLTCFYPGSLWHPWFFVCSDAIL